MVKSSVTLEDIKKLGVEFGSSALGLHNEVSDVDIAVTTSDFHHHIEPNIRASDVTSTGDEAEYDNVLRNVLSLKCKLNKSKLDKTEVLVNLVVYTTDNDLTKIKTVVDCMKVFQSHGLYNLTDKKLRHHIFEGLVDVAYIDDYYFLPVIDIDEDDIPF
jgi:predicted nucleotidyltransferase